MAIAKVLRADIVCGASESAALLDLLEGSGLVEVVDAHAELPPEAAEVEVRPSVDLSSLVADLPPGTTLSIDVQDLYRELGFTVIQGRLK